MDHFMAQYRSQLSFVIEFDQQSPINSNLATRQRPRIRYRIIQNYKLVGQFRPITQCRKRLPHTGYIVLQ